MTKARLFYDNYHLILNQGENLGPLLFYDVESLLYSLMNSNSHEIFEKCKELILQKYPGYPKLQELLSYYTAREDTIATYAIDETEGSFSRCGSAPSEQNHSSIVSVLGKDVTGNLDKLLLALLERHNHKCLRTNEDLCQNSGKMRIICNKLMNITVEVKYSKLLLSLM